MKIKSKYLEKNDFAIVFYLILFRISLEVIYLLVINKMYLEHPLLSRGVYIIDINIAKYIISWVIFIFFSFLFVNINVTNYQKCSEIIILALFIMSFIPSISLFGLANLDYKYLIYFVLFWFILLVFTNAFRQNIIKIQFGSNNKIKVPDIYKALILVFILVFFIVFSIYLSNKYNGFNINFTLNTELQYENRLKFRSMGESRISNYLRNWAMGIIIPTAAVICLYKKHYYAVIILGFIQLLLFGIDMQKMALFIFPLALLAYKFYSSKIIKYIPVLLIGLNILSFFEFFVLKTRFILNNLIIRLFYLPAILSNCYYEFIEKSKWYVIPASSIFRRLGLIHEYPYSNIGLPYMIGYEYFSNYNISANTGMFGSAYSYSIIGVVIIPVVYALLFNILDYATEGLKINLFISILLFLIFAITGATIFAVLLPYGLLITIFILLLLRNNCYFK